MHAAWLPRAKLTAAAESALKGQPIGLASEPQCHILALHGSLSGGLSCTQLRDQGGCYQWWMDQGNFCGDTCGR